MANEMVENTIPVLAVSSVAASIRFYCEVLGFVRDWGGDGELADIASVSRDGHAIMLQRRQPVGGGYVWIGGPGLVALWRKIGGGGVVTIVQRPTNQRWALEMKVKDLDGNVLWFGNEPMEGVAFGTEPAL